ncbi:hypothetical protein J6590_005701 [Homalodisca vitripennis]|nr:hypothetical protein J6590_005701 [Homalodisca vitripennis]
MLFPSQTLHRQKQTSNKINEMFACRIVDFSKVLFIPSRGSSPTICARPLEVIKQSQEVFRSRTCAECVCDCVRACVMGSDTHAIRTGGYPHAWRNSQLHPRTYPSF